MRREGRKKNIGGGADGGKSLSGNCSSPRYPEWSEIESQLK